jgi:hypothetical protein
MKLGKCLLVLLSVTAAMFAKDPPAQVMNWPENGATVVRFSFGRFHSVSSAGNRKFMLSDVVAQNLWSKPISRADFAVYLFDKNKARIGEGFLSLTNVGPGEVVKFQFSSDANGDPVSMGLVARSLPPELQAAAPPRVITVTVNSVPQGAGVKMDGKDVGTTPKMVQVGVGKHELEFSKEGYNTGHFPLEIGPDDVSGGSMSYELGTSAHDTLEMRDGTVISGDLESMTATDVTVRIAGGMQSFDRNKIKRILLVERDRPVQ